MKLLVTGGAGFIGSNFVRYWLQTHPQDSIVNLDLLTYAGNPANLADIEQNTNYSFVKGDICDAPLVNRVMEGIDTVVHFAAETHVDRSIMDPSAFIRTNVLGTYTLAEAALKHSIKRFHHVSTDEVFGALPLESEKKFTETTSYDPRSPYSASKASSDHIIRAYFHTYGLPVTITNCSNNFGPYHYPEKLIPLAITNLLEGKQVPVYGDGKYVRDWLYVEDHCTAIDRVLTDGQIGKTYCVGGMSRDVSNLEVVKMIISMLGKDEGAIEYVKDRPGHDRRYSIDWSLIHHDLDWKPKYEFHEWLQITVDWYKNNESWWKPLKNADYQQYYHKQYTTHE
jgi:dTDP-glucose 4,6-dehydratase